MHQVDYSDYVYKNYLKLPMPNSLELLALNSYHRQPVADECKANWNNTHSQ